MFACFGRKSTASRRPSSASSSSAGVDDGSKPRSTLGRSVNVDSLDKPGKLLPGDIVLFFGAGDGTAPRTVGCTKAKQQPTSCIHAALIVHVDGEPCMVEVDGIGEIRYFPAKLVIRWRLVNDMELTSIQIRRLQPGPMTTKLHQRLGEFTDSLSRHRLKRPPSGDTAASFFNLPRTVSFGLITDLFREAGMFRRTPGSLRSPHGWAQPWSRMASHGMWRQGVQLVDGVPVLTSKHFAAPWDGEGEAAIKEYRRSSVCSIMSEEFGSGSLSVRLAVTAPLQPASTGQEPSQACGRPPRPAARTARESTGSSQGHNQTESAVERETSQGCSSEPQRKQAASRDLESAESGLETHARDVIDIGSLDVALQDGMTTHPSFFGATAAVLCASSEFQARFPPSGLPATSSTSSLESRASSDSSAHSKFLAEIGFDSPEPFRPPLASGIVDMYGMAYVGTDPMSPTM